MTTEADETRQFYEKHFHVCILEMYIFSLLCLESQPLRFLMIVVKAFISYFSDSAVICFVIVKHTHVNSRVFKCSCIYVNMTPI